VRLAAPASSACADQRATRRVAHWGGAARTLAQADGSWRALDRLRYASCRQACRKHYLSHIIVRACAATRRAEPPPVSPRSAAGQQRRRHAQCCRALAPAAWGGAGAAEPLGFKLLGFEPLGLRAADSGGALGRVPRGRDRRLPGGGAAARAGCSPAGFIGCEYRVSGYQGV